MYYSKAPLLRTNFLILVFAIILSSRIQAQVVIGTQPPNNSAALDISSTSRGLLPPRMTEAQRNAIAAAEGLMIYNTTTKRPNIYTGFEWMNFDGTVAGTFVLGSRIAGGIVFYILQPGDPGYIAGETHGLIAATSDQPGSDIPFGCNGKSCSAIETAIGKGLINTTDIAGPRTPDPPCCSVSAAAICLNLVLNGYSDWFLPSKDELYKMYLNRATIGNLNGADFYWSSSETGYYTAWAQRMSGSSFNSQFKQSKLGGDGITAARVRAVRYF